jgi:hypothetical protein
MRLLLAALTALGAAAPALAQVSTVDEGSFTITRHGARVGREEFRIRRTATGEATVTFVATATVALADRQLVPELRADGSGAVLAYRVEVTGAADATERLKGALERGLFTAVVSSPRGESAREYVVSPGAVVLDDDVYHQYYFVARLAARGPLAVVVPRRNAQVAMRLEAAGSEPVTTGGRAVPATHLVLSEPAGAARDIWADAEGRILRVAIPSLGIVATRDEPPR